MSDERNSRCFPQIIHFKTLQANLLTATETVRMTEGAKAISPVGDLKTDPPGLTSRRGSHNKKLHAGKSKWSRMAQKRRWKVKS